MIPEDGFTPWPEELASRYREAGFWSGERLDMIAAQHLPERAGETALIDDAGSLTYLQLEAAVRLASTSLEEAGVANRDRVVLHLGNRIGFIVAALALMRIGAIPVYSLPAHGERELIGISRTAGAVGFIVSAEDEAGRIRAESAAGQAGELRVLTVEDLVPEGALSGERADTAGPEGLPPDPQAEVGTGEVAFLQLSGGTTGTPKLIPRTHDDYHFSIRRSVEVCRITRDDTMLILLPAAHNFPMSSPGFLGMLHAGGAAVLAGARPPRKVFELIARSSATIMPLVPPLALTLVNAAERAGEDIAPLLAPLRTVQVGGAKLAPELAARIGPALGADLQQVFGMAEGLVCYTDPLDTSERVFHVQGRPMSDADEVRIVGPDGREVPDGEPGDLQTRGPYTIRGYWRNPEANAASFTADGFYRTGDVVRRDADGHLSVRGRSKDHINRGGEKISAEEVENLLMKHPLVDDAVVVGVPDEYLGEKAVGVIVPAAENPDGRSADEQDLTAEALIRHMRELRVESLKIPDRFVLRGTLPTTGVGKISRADLRTGLQQELSRPGTTGEPAIAHEPEITSEKETV